MATRMGMADGRAFTQYLGPQSLQSLIDSQNKVDNNGFRQLAYKQGTAVIPKVVNESPMPWLTTPTPPAAAPTPTFPQPVSFPVILPPTIMPLPKV